MTLQFFSSQNRSSPSVRKQTEKSFHTICNIFTFSKLSTTFDKSSEQIMITGVILNSSDFVSLKIEAKQDQTVSKREKIKHQGKISFSTVHGIVLIAHEKQDTF